MIKIVYRSYPRNSIIQNCMYIISATKSKYLINNFLIMKNVSLENCIFYTTNDRVIYRSNFIVASREANIYKFYQNCIHAFLFNLKVYYTLLQNNMLQFVIEYLCNLQDCNNH